MENELIKQTMATKGWELIEKMLRDKIVDIRLARNINSKKPYADIAVDVLANAKAARKVESVLRRLTIINNGQNVKKESFK